MRSTVHLVSARDLLPMHALTRETMARVHRSAWSKRLNGADPDAIAAAGRELLAHRPMTRVELREALAERWPDADRDAVAWTVTYLLPVVQVPPRGLWGHSGQARLALSEEWLGAPLPDDASIDELVLRYLAAFGPATPSDVRTWSNITGLREVLTHLRPDLVTYRDEQGRELLDVPNGALPDPDTPAPPRFLPEYDNVTLSHEDRSRVLGDDRPASLPSGTWKGSLLVDGFHRATWSVDTTGDDVAALHVHRLRDLPTDPRSSRDEVTAEGHGLLALIAPEAEHRVTFVD
jgi:hypothetical protein